MTHVHILRYRTDIGYWTPWKTTTAVIKWTRGTLAMPDCCWCRRPARETQVQLFRIRRNIPLRDIPYMTPPPRFRCTPGKGCNAEPWSRAGAHLRCEMRDGLPTFKRLCDGAHLEMVD